VQNNGEEGKHGKKSADGPRLCASEGEETRHSLKLETIDGIEH
jgi:hypothetical protein